MAYPKNVKLLAISLNEQGHSAEQIEFLFQQIVNKGTEKGFPLLSGIAEKSSINFTEVDWYFLIKATPGAKTIRLWLPRSSRTNTDESTELEPHFSKRRQDTNSNPIIDICYASPDEIDVKMMRQWKIPTRDAPKVLSEWRSAHSQNKHEICVLYKVLIEDLTQRQIPYKQAKGMFELGKNALILSSEKIQKEVESARTYRPWETREGHEQFINEIDNLFKPSEVKLLHLKDITCILEVLLAEVEVARSIGRWENVITIEELYTLFPNAMDHCFYVGWEFSTIKLLQYQCNHETTIIINLIEKGRPPIANNGFARSVLNTAICHSMKIPVRYELSITKSQNYELSIEICGVSVVVARGSKQDMETCKYLHTELTGRFRKNPRFKSLIKQRRKIIGHLNKLEAEIHTALSDPYFIYSTCFNCP